MWVFYYASKVPNLKEYITCNVDRSAMLFESGNRGNKRVNGNITDRTLLRPFIVCLFVFCWFLWCLIYLYLLQKEVINGSIYSNIRIARLLLIVIVIVAIYLDLTVCMYLLMQYAWDHKHTKTPLWWHALETRLKRSIKLVYGNISNLVVTNANRNNLFEEKCQIEHYVVWTPIYLETRHKSIFPIVL